MTDHFKTNYMILNVIWQKWKINKLRVQIHLSQGQIYKLRVQIYELRVNIYELRLHIYELLVQKHVLEN